MTNVCFDSFTGAGRKAGFKHTPGKNQTGWPAVGMLHLGGRRTHRAPRPPSPPKSLLLARMPSAAAHFGPGVLESFPPPPTTGKTSKNCVKDFNAKAKLNWATGSDRPARPNCAPHLLAHRAGPPRGEPGTGPGADQPTAEPSPGLAPHTQGLQRPFGMLPSAYDPRVVLLLKTPSIISGPPEAPLRSRRRLSDPPAAGALVGLGVSVFLDYFWGWCSALCQVPGVGTLPAHRSGKSWAPCLFCHQLPPTRGPAACQAGSDSATFTDPGLPLALGSSCQAPSRRKGLLGPSTGAEFGTQVSGWEMSINLGYATPPATESRSPDLWSRTRKGC